MSEDVNQRAVLLVPPNLRVQTYPAGSAIISPPAWEAIARSLKLSGRELQIVKGIFDDGTDLGIAQDMGISVHTIHTHVERLHHKLAVMNRPQLLLRIMKEFLTLTASSAHNLPPICANYAAPGCPFGA